MDQIPKPLRRLGRRAKQSLQLIHLLARADKTFAVGIISASFSFLSAFVSFVAALYGGSSFWASVSAAIFFVFGLVSAIWAAIDFRGYSLDTNADVARTKTLDSITRFGRQISFSALRPSADEKEFSILEDPTITQNCYMRSEKFDNYLMTLEQLPFQNTESRSFGCFSGDDEIKRYQIQYLLPRLRAAKKLPTTNDQKCGLSMKLGIPITDVKTYKVGFFDSLITNEAFRSEIRLASKLNEKDPGRSIQNLTSSFPAGIYADNSVYLEPLHRGGAGNHLGATCLIVTDDQRVLLFRQGDTNVSRGQITTISGSLDWQDATLSNDLFAAVRRGFVRELCEEASAARVYKREKGIWSQEGRISEAAKHVLVTGFFRWVDRCGKPEFVGVGTTPFKQSDLPPDEFEVTKFRMDVINDFVIQRMDDFQALLGKLRYVTAENPKLKVGLSSYVALLRLCEIASYRNSDRPEQRAAFKKVSDHLRLS